MYENYWNLREKPFRNVTEKKFFFYAETYEEAYLRLLYSVTESQGMFMLLGDSGCGKSLLCKIFMQDMLEQGYRIAFIKNPSYATDEFLPQVLYEFGGEVDGKTKLQLLREFNKLFDNSKKKQHFILIVDEAHLIKGNNTFEEIRLLLNLENDNRFVITPILVGNCELGEIVSNSPLKDRIALQYRLRPLNCREAGEYIYYRMNKAGCMRDIFTAEAIKEIYAITKGNLRDINKICDLALLLGYGDNAIVIEPVLIRKALTDLRGETRHKDSPIVQSV